MSRFKTELCNNLIELGTCKYGDRCHYAHGAHELRQVSRRHPKYRTERCKNFELTGKCPFGPRCSYVHPKPDLDSMIDQLTKYMKHTKAPKPDSEDDGDEDEVSLPFTRTNTSISTCDSMLAIDDENKENNQRLLNTSLYQNTQQPLSDSSSAAFALKPSSSLLNCSKAEQLFAREVGAPALKEPIARPLGLKNSSLSSSNLASYNDSTTHVSGLQSRSSQAPVSSNIIPSIITRTPLADTSNHQNRQVLTPLNLNNRNNFQVTSSSDQISSTKAAYFKGTNSTKNSLYEATSYESTKKPRLIDIDSSSSASSNTNNTISYPFAISNPLSDYLNNTNPNGRNPLNPNKQFYARF